MMDGPDDALGGIIRAAWFAANAQDCADSRTDWWLITADDDDRGSAVAGNIGTRSVNDKSQVLMCEEVFNQLSAELAFHERVARDLADPARSARRSWPERRTCAMNGTVSA